MHNIILRTIEVSNFRLLADTQLGLEDETTVIVGRNNSGKTSLGEVVRRFLMDSSPKFQLEDFSAASIGEYASLIDAAREEGSNSELRKLLPFIELRLTFEYSNDPARPLGPLSPFIVDLEPACTEALVVARYELRDGQLAQFLRDLPQAGSDDNERALWISALKALIPRFYAASVWAVDPNDATNKRQLGLPELRALIRSGFINAQRGLDDVSTRESNPLGKTIELLFTKASLPSAASDDKQIADRLSDAVKVVQDEINRQFGLQLQGLVPALGSFGYPGLGDQALLTETILDVGKLLSNFTKVRYEGYEGMTLPESHNGLGARNLIFILLQLASFYKEYCSEANPPGLQIIFIEEPEAHLHPQMQEVFIRQLAEAKRVLISNSAIKKQWPVQFIVSTHSPHVANEAGFESLRYFLSTSPAGGYRRTVIKDLRRGIPGSPCPDRDFLHKYLSLTKCDLFFADKAVLVEGLSERLLIPRIIEKIENSDSGMPRLSSHYLTILEVGGAYAHLFFDLLQFLELRTLIITDIDSVSHPGGKACPVHAGKATSNSCLKTWFSGDDPLSPSSLLLKADREKTRGNFRIAYQCPEITSGPCGRTLEDAFILANQSMFGITGSTSEDLENAAWSEARNFKKSAFAIKHAIQENDWQVPRYLADGVRWLAGSQADAAIGSPCTDNPDEEDE